MLVRKSFFRRPANRFLVFIPGYGMVPVAEDKDDKPFFLTGMPRHIGDLAVIEAEGKRRRVKLLHSEMCVSATYLVDMGPAYLIPPLKSADYDYRKLYRWQD